MIIIIPTIKYGFSYYNTFTMGGCSNYHGFFFQCRKINKLFNTLIVKTITHNCRAYPNQCCLAGGAKCSLGASLNFNEVIRHFPEVPLTNFFSFR